MKKVYIVGIGQTQQGTHPDKDLPQLCVEATMDALADAEMRLDDLEAIWAAQVPISADTQFASGQMIVDALGVPVNTFCIVTSEACVAGGQAFHNAFLALSAGYYKTALVLGASKIFDTLNVYDTVAEFAFLPYDALNGFGYGRWDVHKYIEDNGVTEDDIDAFRRTTNWYSSNNPKSWFYGHSFPNREEFQAKVPYELYPFRFGEWSCKDVEGASAVILATEDVASEYSDTPVRVASSTHREESSYTAHSLSNLYSMEEDQGRGNEFVKYSGFHCPSVVKSWNDVLTRANVKPDDLDVLQPHEATISITWSMIDSLRHSSIPFGKAAKWYTEGQAMPGGKLPCNTAGTFKSYNLGGICLQYTIENVLQLREAAGKRQAPMKNYVAASIVSPMRPWASVLVRDA